MGRQAYQRYRATLIGPGLAPRT